MGTIDRGRLPKSFSENSCLGKWKILEQVHERVIKNLGRIPGWRRGVTRKTPACEQKY
jgi:hypothetical protein